jgi:excisionase family DNA binding protein
MTNLKKILTINEIAEYLKVHPMTVYKYVKEGKIPAFKIGKSWRIQKDSIQKWMGDNEREIKGGKV